MNPICPIRKVMCWDCLVPCTAPTINDAAIIVPKEEPEFHGILATVVKVADTVSVETNFQDEHKLNVKVQL
jgi:hypothetical protein